ncbi:MAG: class C sortase [Arcanobacterium sp.]
MTTTRQSGDVEPVEVSVVHKAGPKRTVGSFIPLLLVLAGILVLLYPVIATQYNNVKQHEFASKYSTQAAGIPQATREAELEAARAYNSTLEGIPILDPWLLDVAQDPGSDSYIEYSSQLDVVDVMARVRIPAVNIDLPVYHGTDDEVLRKGVGHLYGTSLPVGGMDSHAVLTSHTGMPDATLFDRLPDVEEGDLILIEVLGETLAYQVDQIKVVEPDEIGDLTKIEGHDYLTLFTCTPYGVNSHRLLVRGERVEYTPEIADIAEQEISPFRVEPWMWFALAGAIAGIVILVVVIRKERGLRKRLQGVKSANVEGVAEKEADSDTLENHNK